MSSLSPEKIYISDKMSEKFRQNSLWSTFCKPSSRTRVTLTKVKTCYKSVAIASEKESEEQANCEIVSFTDLIWDLRSKATHLDEVSLDKTKDPKIKDLVSDNGTKFPDYNQ